MKQSEIKELPIADLKEKLGALQKNYLDLTSKNLSFYNVNRKLIVILL